MALSDRIKEARLKSSLTQEQLAHMIGAAKSTITGYEKGNRIPPAAVVGLIADATNVDTNFLYQDEVKKRHDNTVSLEEFSIVKKYRELDPHGKKMVDFTLNEEWERSNAERKVIPIAVREDTEFSEELTPDKDYLKPQAAHNDNESKEQLTPMQEDMSILKRPE